VNVFNYCGCYCFSVCYRDIKNAVIGNRNQKEKFVQNQIVPKYDPFHVFTKSFVLDSKDILR